MDQYRIAPEADWIIEPPEAIPAPSDGNLPEAPFYFLFADSQECVSAKGFESYRRTVEHVLDASRLEDASLIVHELGASNEQLVLHHLRVIRDGTVRNALEPDNIEVLQREAELERHITNRRYTISLSIDDLRVGDVIDYAATEIIRPGDHPLQGRYYHSRNLLSWGCPVRVQRVRIVNRSDRALTVQECRYRDGRFTRTHGKVAAGDSFTMMQQDPPLVRIRDSAPEWFWPDHLWIVTQANWKELSAYMWSAYNDQGVLNDDLPPIASLVGDTDDQEQAVLAVIDFVQNGIRYKGEHHGIFSHLPRPAAEVLKRRSGDCKDKSNLLRALLNALGIPARMVLVNTRRGSILPSLPPSLYHFDHMVVHLEWNGKSHYIDPTIKKQAGDLEHRALLDLAQGLALTEPGESLKPIPWDLSREVYNLRHRYDFSSEQESDYRIEIEREYRYHRADNMRYHIHATPRQKLEQDFQAYAATDTGLELEATEPFHIIEDDARLNRLKTRECYRIRSGPGEGERQVNIYTDLVGELGLDSQALHPIVSMWKAACDTMWKCATGGDTMFQSRNISIPPGLSTRTRYGAMAQKCVSAPY